MGITDIPGIIGRVGPKKDSEKPDSTKKTDDTTSSKSEALTKPGDTIEITDAKIAIEKENLLASQNSIEDFDQAKSLLTSIMTEIDEQNLLEIHGNADKIKTLLIM